LVQSNVTINGSVSLDGFNNNAGDPNSLPEPGPGGFRAGFNAGLGPGGSGGPGAYSGNYGNAQIVPLIGGPGGGGSGAVAGGGGGGPILIAAAGTIQINSRGSCHANGGTGGFPGAGIGGGGSGGGIRLVASQISGNGTILATGNSAGGPGII